MQVMNFSLQMDGRCFALNLVRLNFQCQMLIYQSKANFDKEILLGKILYGNREFHDPFWSMIYVALRFEVNAIVSFRN